MFLSIRDNSQLIDTIIRICWWKSIYNKPAKCDFIYWHVVYTHVNGNFAVSTVLFFTLPGFKLIQSYLMSLGKTIYYTCKCLFSYFHWIIFSRLKRWILAEKLLCWNGLLLLKRIFYKNIYENKKKACCCCLNLLKFIGKVYVVGQLNFILSLLVHSQLEK